MKNKRNRGLIWSSFLGLALWAGSAQAQTNFYWTNTATGFWSTNANWTNGAPIAGGGTNYVLNFLTPATTVSTTNTLGVGGTILSNGELSISMDANIGGPTSAITFAGGLLQLNGATLNNLYNNLGSLQVNWTNINGGIDVVSPYALVTISSNMSGSSFTKTGKGFMTLSGAIGTAGLSVSNGTLRLAGGDFTVAPTTAVTAAGGTLDLVGSTQTNSAGVSFKGGWVRDGTIIKSGADYDAQAGTVAANLQGNVGLTKSGLGTLTLLGSNTYNGASGTTLSNGTLAIVSDANISGSTSTINFNGGTLQILGTAITTLDGHTLNLNAGSTLDINNAANTVTLTNSYTFGNSLTKAGAGTLVLANNNSGSSPLTISAGTLQVGTNGATGSLGTGNVTNNNALVFNRNNSYVVNNNINGSGALTQLGTGTTVLAGTNTYIGLTTVSAGTLTFGSTSSNNIGAVTVSGGAAGGTLNINGVTTLGANNLIVANATGDRSVVVITTNLTVSQIQAGVTDGANNAGVVYQTGGTVTITNSITLGGGSGDYGYYRLTNGTNVLNNASSSQLGVKGYGVFEMTGGTLMRLTGGSTFIGGNGATAGAVGMLNIFGGTYSSSSGANFDVMGGTASGGTYGLLNVGGSGMFNSAYGATAKVFDLMWQAGNTNVVNLLTGGTIIANKVQAGNATGQSIFNFNGGTLVTPSSSTVGGSFMTGLTAAYVYEGGAIIDTTNISLTIGQALLAPTGYGVTNIALGSYHGTNYIGTPVVLITGGSGRGATALAQVDFSNGEVTNILITSYGSGYLPTDTLTVRLLGGGATSNAMLGTITLGANTNSGGLIKLGSGALTLSGTNTYGGGSIISNGLLQFNAAAALPATGTVTINALGAAAFNWAGLQNVLTTQVNTASAGAIALLPVQANETINFNTAGLTNAFLGAASGNTILYTGNFTPFDANVYKLGGGNGTLIFTQAISGTTLTIGTGGGQSNIVWLDNASFSGGITLNSNTTLSVVSSLGSGALTNNGGTLQVRGSSLNSLNLASIAGSNVFDINFAGNTVTIAGNFGGNGSLTKQGAGTLVLGGSNSINGAVTISAGALRITNGDALDGTGSNVTVASGAALQLGGNINSEWGDQLTLSSTGIANDGALRNISDTNTWRGPVVLGSATRINADAGLLTLSSNINNGTFALTVGGAGNTLISGAITNSGSLIKDGSGTLTLTGANTYTNTSTINSGGMVLDFSQSAVANNIIATNSALIMGGGALVVNPSLTVISTNAGVSTQSFAGLTINAGVNSIIGSNASGGTLVLNLGALTRASGGGMLDVTLPGGSGKITTPTSTNVTGTLSNLVTVGGVDWATISGASPYAITNYTGYTNVTAAGLLPSNNNNNARILTGSLATITNAAANTIINTLLVNDSAVAHVLYLTNSTLTVGNPGAILLARGSSGFTVGSSANDGYLKSSGELNLINYSANTLTINAAISNGSTALTINGTGPVTLNGTNNYSGATTINGGNVSFTTNNVLGAVTVNAGALTFGGGANITNTIGGAITVANGTFTNNTFLAAGANTLTIANGANQVGVFNIAGGVFTNSGTDSIGGGYGSVGIINQTSGTATFGGAVYLGGGSNRYAAYLLSGSGAVSFNGDTGGANNGGGANTPYNGANSLISQTGGSITSLNWFTIARDGGVGVYDLSGGTHFRPTNSANYLYMAGNSAGGYAQVNVRGGGTLDLENAAGLSYGSGGQLSTGVVNLITGGMLQLPRIQQNGASIYSIFNFDGGTLQAVTNVVATNGQFTSTFMQGLNAAYVRAGGAVIDDNGLAITIGQSLLAPTGYGVSSIGATGSNYLAPPVVLITGGSGIGATAVAQLDGAGNLTNILLTSAGSGYLPNDTVNVQLLGGGGVGSVTNIGWSVNTSGGLTKLGTGTLTLTGTNTYGGTTTISSGGTLVFQPVVNTTNVIGGLGGSGTNLYNGLGVTILGGDSSSFTGSATINTGMVQFATLNALPTNSTGGVLVNSQGIAALGFTGIDGAKSLTNFNSTSTGIIAFTPTSAGQTFDFNTANLSNAWFGGFAGSTFSGTLTPANGAAKLTTISGGTWTNAASLGSGNSLTLGAGPGLFTSTGTVVFTGANTHSGATTISTNNTLQAGAVNTLSPNSLLTMSANTPTTGTAPAGLNTAGFSQNMGSLAGSGYINNSTTNLATLTIGNDNATATYMGNITGTNALTKAGYGTQMLGGFHTYTGPTIVNGGTLGLLASATLNSTVTITNGATFLASGVNNNLQGQLYYNATYSSGTDPSFNSLATINTHFAGLNPNAIATGSLTSANFDYGSGGAGFPAPFTTSGTNFQGKWAGKFNATTNGLYMFGLSSDDASMLYIDGSIVVNHNVAGAYTSGPPGQASGTIQLTPGLHEIVIVFNQGGGGYGLTAYEANPGGTTNVLSSALLSYGPTINTLAGDFGTTVALSNTLLTVNQLSDATFNGNLTNYVASDMFFKTGPGMLTLGGTNTAYNGSITVNNGVLMFGTNTALTTGAAASTLVNPNGAVAFNFAGIQNWLTNINPWSSGSIALTTNNANENLDFNTLNLSNAYLGAVGNVNYTGSYTNFGTVTRLGGGGGTLVFNQAITNGSVVVGGGPGTVIFDTNNSYSGTTLISTGSVLQIGNNDAAGTLGTGNVTNNATLAFNRTDAVTINNLIAGTGTLLQNGSGSTLLTASNSYSGLTVINNGQLALGNTYAAQNSTVSNNVASGGLLFANSITNATLGGLAGTGNIALTNDTGAAITLQVGANNVSTLYGGVLSDGGQGGSLVKIGINSTLMLTGSNTYTGATIVYGGNGTGLILSNATGAAIQGNLQIGAVGDVGGNVYVKLAAPNQLGPNSVLFMNKGANVISIPVLELLGNNQLITGITNAGATYIENTQAETGYGNAILTISNSVNNIFDGTIRSTGTGSGTLGLTKDGAAVLTLAGSGITYTGPTLINGGTLMLSNTTAFASPITNNASLVIDGPGNMTIPLIYSTGSALKLGAGTLILSGASGVNTFLNGITLSNGVLQIGNAGATGDLIGTVTNLATVAINRTGLYTNLTTILGGNVTMAGSGLTILGDSNSTYTNVAINAGNLVINTLPSQIANISITSLGALVNAGASYTNVMDWLNPAQGHIATNSAGTIALLTGGNYENITMGAYRNLSLGAALNNTATFLGALTPANGTTNYLIGGGGGTLIIGGANAFTDGGSLTNRGVIVGNGGSASTVVVLGPQSYSGGTTITNATLQVSSDNQLGYGGITLNAGGTLQLTNAPGFTTLKNITQGGGTLNISAGSTLAVYGGLLGSGTLTLTNGGAVSFNGANNASGAITVNGPSNVTFAGSGTLGAVTIANSTPVNFGGSVNLGALTINTGSAVVNTYGTNTSTGTFNDNGGTLLINTGSVFTVAVTTGNAALGNTSGQVVNVTTYGTLNITATGAGWISVGNTGLATNNVIGGGVETWSAQAGSANGMSIGQNYQNNGAKGTSLLNISNGTFTASGGAGFYIGGMANNGGLVTGVLNIASGLADLSGAGLISLGNGTNTTAGSGIINLNSGGVLRVNSGITKGTNTAATGFINFNGGTLQASGNFTITNNLTAINVSNLTATSYIDSSNFVVTVSNNMSGSGTLTKLGNGTLLLAGSNTYGVTAVNAGTLWFASTQAINGVSQPGATNITINTNGTLAAAGAYTNVTAWLGSGRIATNSTGAIGMITNNSESITMGVFSNLYLGVVAGSNVQYSGVLTPANGAYRLAAGYLATNTMMNVNALLNASTYGLLVAGPGMVVLAQSNSYTGGTLIQSGATLLLSNNVAAGTGKITNNFGGVLVAGYALDQTTLTNLSPASAGVVALGANSSSNLDFSATGANLANVSLGAVGVRTNSGTITPYGTTYVLGGGGGTLVITNNTLTNLTANLIAFGGGTGGNLVLTGTNTYGGGTLIGALGTATVATVSLGSGAVTNNGTLVFSTNGVLQNVLSGTGSLVVNNLNTSGMLIITNYNPFTGAVYINSGVLALSNQTPAQTSLATTTINLGNGSTSAWLRLYANQQLNSASVLSMTGSAVSGAKFELNGFTQTVAAIVTGGASDYIQNLESGGSGTGLLIVSNNAVNSVVTVGALRDMTGKLALTKDGTAQLSLIGNVANYTGPTTVNNGILALSNTTAFASPVTINGGQLLLMTATAASNSTITLNANNGLGFASGNAFTIGGLAGNGGLTLWSGTGGGVNLSVGLNGSNTTYSGVLSDGGPGNWYQGNLTKVGTGLLWLTGSNTYNGVTTIAGGQLRADPGAGLPQGTELVLNGGVWETSSGMITNTLGGGAGQILIAGGNSGFSAYSNALTVSLNGGSPLVWSNTPGFAPSSLVLNDVTATTNLTFQNGLDLNGATRTVTVNSTNAGAYVTLSAPITNSAGTIAGLTKSGNGVLLLTQTNAYNGLTTVSGGILQGDFGVGLNGATNVTLNGGTLSSAGGNITAALGTGAGQINISGGASGFSAYNTNLMVNVGGAGATLNWGSANFAPSALVLNDFAANTNLTFQNGLNLNGTTRTINVNSTNAGATATISGNLLNYSGTAGLIKGGAGTLMLTGSNIAYNGTTTINGGTLTLAGSGINSLGAVVTVSGGAAGGTLVVNNPTTLNGYNLVVGNAANDRAVVIINTNLNFNQTQLGSTGTAAGAIYQNGGTVNQTAANGATDFALGNAVGSYGYYRLNGGQLNIAEAGVGSTTGGNGVLDITGGTMAVSGYFLVGRINTATAPQAGEVNVSGGVLNLSGAANTLAMNWIAGATNLSMLNVLGNGWVNAGAKSFSLMNAASPMSAGIINLETGGTLTVGQLTGNSGLTLVNFNGGTLQAGAGSATFMTGLTGAYVYANGAYLDSSNYTVTIAQNLLAPTGAGVTNISLSSYGSGYIGTPIVQITGGGGTGATALAQVDLTAGSPTYGQLTNILMLSAGFGYTNLPTVSLIGGGALTSASNFTVSTNTITSGALTKLGSGTLILSGTNTYGGGTFVNAGLLQFNAMTNIAGSGRNVTANFGGSVTLTNAVNTTFLDRLALNSSGTVALVANNANALDFSAFTNLSLGAANGTWTNTGAITPYNNTTYNLGGGGGTLVITNNLTSGTTLNAFCSGSGGTLILGGSNTFSMVSYSGLGTLLITTNLALGSATNGLVVGFGNAIGPTYMLDTNFLGMIDKSSLGTVTLGANSTNAFNFNDLGFTNLSLGAANGSWTNSGLLTPYNSIYNLGGGGTNGTLVLTNLNALTGNSTVNFFSSGSGGRVILTTNNNFVGNVTVSNATGTVEFRSQLGLGTNNNITVYAGTVFANVGATAFVVGTNNNNQQLLVTGSSSVWTNSNSLVVGGGTGASGNSVVLSNGASLFSSGTPSYIGSGTGANSNSVTVYAGSTWNLGGTNLYVGSGSATGNVLTINGGTVSNAYQLIVGFSGGWGNQLIVTNGGVVGPMTQDLLVGNAANNNAAIFTGPNTLLNGNSKGLMSGWGGSSNSVTFDNGAVARNVYYVVISGSSGGSYNSVLITNGAQVYVTSGGSTSLVGGSLNASNNTLSVVGAGSVLDLGTRAIGVGTGTNATGNRLVVASGGQINNGGAILVGVGLTNAVANTVGTIGNLMLITNGGTVFSSSQSYLGSGSNANNNAITVSDANSLWNLGAGGLKIGAVTAGYGATAYATNNVLTVNGGTVANSGAIWVGDGENNYALSAYNQMIITNGGKVYSGTGASFIGYEQTSATAMANSNSVLVTGAGSLWDLGAQQLNIGQYAAAGNNLTVNNSGMVTNASALVVGYLGATGAGGNNSVMLTNGAALSTTGGVSSVGYANNNAGANNSNSLTLADGSRANLGGGQLIVGFANAASGSSVGNSINVSGSTLSNVNLLTVGGGAGVYGMNVSGNSLLASNNSYVGSVGLSLGVGGFATNIVTVQGNSVTLASNSFWNMGGGPLTWGGPSSSNNTLFVDSSSVMSNIVGFTLNDAGRVVTIANGSNTNGTGTLNGMNITFGFASGAFNIGTAGNLGGVGLNLVNYTLTNVSSFSVGTVAGANNNSINMTNSQIFVSGTSQLGNGGNSNTMTLVGSVMNMNNNEWAVGRAGTGNVMIISSGAVLTNYSYLESGYNAGAIGNGIIVTNGGRIAGAVNVFALSVGCAAGSASNYFIIGSATTTNSVLDGNGKYITISGNNAANTGNWAMVTGGGVITNTSYIDIGSKYANSIGNYLVITNGGQVFTTGANVLGNQAGANSNSISLYSSGSLWNMNGGSLTIANAASTGNWLLVNGGMVTNVAAITVGGTNAFGNSLIATNGGQLFGSGLIAVGNGGSSNTLYLQNSYVNANGANFYVGYNGNGNVVTLDNTILTNELNFYVGGQPPSGKSYNSATNTTTLINGAQVFLSGAGAVRLGDYGSANQLTVNNSLFSAGGNNMFIGVDDTHVANGNLLTVTNGGYMVLSNLWVGGFSTTQYASPGNNVVVGGQNGSGSNATLVLNGGLMVGTSTGSVVNSLTVLAGGQVFSMGTSYIGYSVAANSNTATVAGGGALWNLGGAALTIGGNAAATGNVLNVQGGGILTNASSVTLGGVGSQFNLAGDAYASNVNLNATDAQLNFNGGTLHASANGNLLSGTGTNYLNGSGGTIDTIGFTVTNAVVNAGSGSLTKLGTGTLTLFGQSTYTGDTTINAGTLAVGNSNALGFGQVTMSGGTLGVVGGGWVVTNTVNLAGDGTVNTTGGSLTLSGAITNTGNLIKSGVNTLTLSGQNTYGGNTTISGGTLQMGTNAALPSATTLKADILGATLDLNGYAQQVSGLSSVNGTTGFVGTITSSASNGTLTVDFANTQNFLGSVTGASTLTLTGGGTLIAAPGSTFASNTWLVVTNNSTLLMNGTHAGIITTYGFSTNGGSGALTTLNVMTNGVYMPGAALGLGTQTVQTLTLNPGGLLAVGLTSLSNGLAQVGTSFAMTNALLQLNLQNYDANSSVSVQQQFTVLTYNTNSVFNPGDASHWFTLQDFGPAAQFGQLLTNNMTFAVGGGLSTTNFFTINYDAVANGQGQITLTAVPEPGTASLLGLIGVAFLVRRLRRRAQS